MTGESAVPGLALKALARPGRPVCFLGDLHGRADLLRLFFEALEQRDPEGRAEVVFLGDLVDRGPASDEVLDRVRAFCTAAPERRHCLMGNHERMMLNFLADPARHGKHWLRAGGEATLAAYGLSPRHGRDPEAEYLRLARALAEALPEGMRDWLAARALFWEGGGLQAAHAGSDPGRPLARQGEAELLWGRRPSAAPGPGGRIEIQGHVIVETAHLAQNRVWLDTGAWRSGRLSALWLGEEAEWIELSLPKGAAVPDHPQEP